MISPRHQLQSNLILFPSKTLSRLSQRMHNFKKIEISLPEANLRLEGANPLYNPLFFQGRFEKGLEHVPSGQIYVNFVTGVKFSLLSKQSFT